MLVNEIIFETNSSDAERAGKANRTYHLPVPSSYSNIVPEVNVKRILIVILVTVREFY